MSAECMPDFDGTSVLVGSTGFVGSNLARSHHFDLAVHASDVERVFGTHPDLVVYAGVPAAMFLANADPAADLAVMEAARENLRAIGAAKVVLVSTVAVYASTAGVDETTPMVTDGLAPYGANRLTLERWVREDFPDALILRLPALYGHGLKKNFLYDLIHITPSMLTPARYEELAGGGPPVADGSPVVGGSPDSDGSPVIGAYELAEDGFWHLTKAGDTQKLRAWFAESPLNALSFTDIRSRFQFLDLSGLWDIIREARDAGIDLMNVATPPVSAAEVYERVTGRVWENHLERAPFDYDVRSVHSLDADGAPSYLGTREDELASVVGFVEREREALARRSSGAPSSGGRS